MTAWIKLAHITMTTAFVMTCSSLLACAFYAWKAKIVKGTTFCALAGIFGIGGNWKIFYYTLIRVSWAAFGSLLKFRDFESQQAFNFNKGQIYQ